MGDIDSGGAARCFLDKERIDGAEAESIEAQAMGDSQLVLEDGYETPFVPSSGLGEELNR
ncbi:MAG TPA: hypothetical protein DCP08_02595 [Chloroflexi bacterium]|nr:hypothetical protein [Chloroflexota bacterium]